MPIVVIELLEGRTIEQKRQLAQDITASFGRIGVPVEAVHIVMHDLPRQNYAAAGKLASDKS